MKAVLFIFACLLAFCSAQTGFNRYFNRGQGNQIFPGNNRGNRFGNRGIGNRFGNNGYNFMRGCYNPGTAGSGYCTTTLPPPYLAIDPQYFPQNNNNNGINATPRPFLAIDEPYIPPSNNNYNGATNVDFSGIDQVFPVGRGYGR